MTNEELYAKYPVAFSGPRRIECGWHGLIEKFLEELIALPGGDTIVLFSIKEKFGQMRIYEESCPESIHMEVAALIDKYERLSLTTCEVCGLPGTRRTGGWIKTLCDADAKTDA